jgi:hypothetical protein
VRRACSRALAIVVATAALAAVPLRAQVPGSDLDSIETAVDSIESFVERRIPPHAALERFRADEDFDYGIEHREPSSLWDAIRRAISRWLRGLLGSKGGNTAVTVTFYVLIAIIVVFVIVKLLDADTRSLFFHRRKEEAAGDLAGDVDVHAIDYPGRIGHAVAAGDFRMAVRLHYLRLLRDLSESGAITWRAGKTDAEYGVELGTSPLRSGFERASLLFEYVWYGDFPIDRQSYERIAEVIDRVSARGVERAR